jgi:predicted regulator of Ras-like GTPase activity (Roadblock/LC7/MglB family)
MAVLQTTILETPSAGQNGHIAASTAGQEETLVRLADANIGCGLFMCEGATPGVTAKAPATAAEAKACIGVNLDPEYLNEIGAAADYLDGDAVTLVQKGYVWINSEGTVAHDGKVYVRHTSDGGSNTTLGKARADSDGTVVIDTTANAVEGVYSITLDNGVVQETFPYTTDGSATTAEIIAALVAAIDASANYSAAGTTEITVTRSAGSEIKVVELRAPTPATQLLWVVTDNQKASALKGARFVKGRTGAGLVKVRLQLRQDF